MSAVFNVEELSSAHFGDLQGLARSRTHPVLVKGKYALCSTLGFTVEGSHTVLRNLETGVDVPVPALWVLNPLHATMFQDADGAFTRVMWTSNEYIHWFDCETTPMPARPNSIHVGPYNAGPYPEPKVARVGGKLLYAVATTTGPRGVFQTVARLCDEDGRTIVSKNAPGEIRAVWWGNPVLSEPSIFVYAHVCFLEGVATLFVYKLRVNEEGKLEFVPGGSWWQEIRSRSRAWCLDVSNNMVACSSAQELENVLIVSPINRRDSLGRDLLRDYNVANELGARVGLEKIAFSSDGRFIAVLCVSAVGRQRLVFVSASDGTTLAHLPQVGLTSSVTCMQIESGNKLLVGFLNGNLRTFQLTEPRAQLLAFVGAADTRGARGTPAAAMLRDDGDFAVERNVMGFLM